MCIFIWVLSFSHFLPFLTFIEQESMVLELMKNQIIAEDDVYKPSEDEEDDDYSVEFASKGVGVLNNLTGKLTKKSRKRKRVKLKKFKEKECDFEENYQDPLVVLGWDIMLMILNHLDARSVALSLMFSRSWHGVASSDVIWSKKCEELWAGKAHLPRVSQTKGLSKLAAYSLSIMDGKRSRIMKEDLWDHAWEFHFNKFTGVIWTHTGKVRAHRLGDTSTLMGPKPLTQVTGFGAATSVVTLSLHVSWRMGR